jgi:heme exporter protein D
MFFDSWESLMYMGGHGAYVWAAYAISVLVLALLLLSPLRRQRRLLRELRGAARRADARANGAG